MDSQQQQQNITHHQLLEFVDSLGSGDHAVLFYEDPEYGRVFQFRFINNGLLRGEHCIYTMHEDDVAFIESEMRQNGIDVDGFKKKNLLHIIKVPNPLCHPEGELKGAENIVSKILINLEPPVRMVSRVIPQIRTEKEVAANVNIERTFHSAFHNFPGSLLCPYHVEKYMEPVPHGKWLLDILESHHAVIFAPGLGKGLAFSKRDGRIANNNYFMSRPRTPASPQFSFDTS